MKGATHIRGHTLDLVVSRETDDIVQSCEVGSFVSDHNAIHIALKSRKPHPIRKQTTFRKLISINVDSFQHDIDTSDLVKSLPKDVDEIVFCYKQVLHGLIDKHAPAQTCAIAQRLSQPWMNEEIAEAKKTCQRAGNLYRKDKSTENRQNYKKCCEIVKDRIQRAKETYFIQKIEDCEQDQKKLFQIVDKLLGRGKSSSLPDYNSVHTLVQIFNEFLISKIMNIRSILSTMESTIQELNCPPLDTLLKPSSSELLNFKLTTSEEISSIIKKASKASYSLDPIPTSLLCDSCFHRWLQLLQIWLMLHCQVANFQQILNQPS